MSKLIYGVGVNDADYIVQPDVSGKRVMCPFYRTWTHMLERCYSEKYRERKPTYEQCTICVEWLTFSNFKKWMEKQDFAGKQLDKDLLIQGNKIYSPDNCVFISNGLNSLLIDHAALRGTSSLGVHRLKTYGKFHAKITVKCKTQHLGDFLTNQEAHAAWQAAKRDIIYNVAQEQTDERLRAALLLRCDQLQYDIKNNLETIKL